MAGELSCSKLPSSEASRVEFQRDPAVVADYPAQPSVSRGEVRFRESSSFRVAEVLLLCEDFDHQTGFYHTTHPMLFGRSPRQAACGGRDCRYNCLASSGHVDQSHHAVSQGECMRMAGWQIWTWALTLISWYES